MKWRERMKRKMISMILAVSLMSASIFSSTSFISQAAEQDDVYASEGTEQAYGTVSLEMEAEGEVIYSGTKGMVTALYKDAEGIQTDASQIGELTYNSSDSSIIGINQYSGAMTFKAGGTATIEAELVIGQDQATTTVSAEMEIQVVEDEITEAYIDAPDRMSVGQIAEARFYQVWKSGKKQEDTLISILSDDKQIISVGTKGNITARASGTTDLVAVYGSETIKKSITVEERANLEYANKILEETQKIIREIYTSESLGILDDEASKLKIVIEEDPGVSRQAEIDQAAAAIEVAMNNLIEIPADTVSLNTIIASLGKMDINIYSAESYGKVAVVLQSAKRLLEMNPTISQQDQVDQAFDQLLGAICGLVEVKDVQGADLTYLKEEIEAAKKIKLGPYTAGSRGNLNNILKMAQALIASSPTTSLQSLVNSTRNSIKSAVKNLEIRPVPKTGIKKATSPEAGKIRVTWKKNASADGYIIQYTQDAKLKKGIKKINIKKNDILSRDIKNLESGQTYYVRVRGYKTLNGSKRYGNNSKALEIQVS